ncbi:PREDICTED: uncharacterized protein LOC104812515 [Tarenaya hassleriana]|uniref:uncharacterized protein LOC104812515 n=1 Tax=Tarenaya hassleriana TaxID=28532 RepID=UPI00053C79E3|nr:PREDICTED: uncharacterized protein LOC104812515 [Tarenaya hassleriana]XP_010538007.1 PREDICTED: uncharacterized protein LOC104812515 [Tarenaya hassleriana]
MGEERIPSRDRRRRGGLRALIEPRCLSPFARSDGGSGARWRSVYLKLPPQRLIKLSVVKLDGSFFDVHIAKDCTVEELKRAVEEVFTMSPRQGQDMISWSHVWGHFCLCYQGQKLITDKASIRNLGINDGDQLHFVRHLSIDRSPLHRRSKSHGCKNHLESQTNQNKGEDVPESSYPGAQDELPASEFRIAHLFKGWIPNSGLWPERWSRPSMFSLKRFGGRPKMIQF